MYISFCFFWCVYDYNIYKVPSIKVTIWLRYISYLFLFLMNQLQLQRRFSCFLDCVIWWENRSDLDLSSWISLFFFFFWPFTHINIRCEAVCNIFISSKTPIMPLPLSKITTRKMQVWYYCFTFFLDFTILDSLHSSRKRYGVVYLKNILFSLRMALNMFFLLPSFLGDVTSVTSKM